MESRAKLFGHAIHPVLIVFPLGLLSTGVIFDVIYLIWGNPTFATVAYYMTAAGVVGGAGLALLTGWLGGELVERLGVSVDDGAHLDAPNSLSGKPANQNN